MNISSWSGAQMMDSKGEAECKAGIGDETRQSTTQADYRGLLLERQVSV